jgi:hypothetical protein
MRKTGTRICRRWSCTRYAIHREGWRLRVLYLSTGAHILGATCGTSLPLMIGRVRQSVRCARGQRPRLHESRLALHSLSPIQAAKRRVHQPLADVPPLGMVIRSLGSSRGRLLEPSIGRLRLRFEQPTEVACQLRPPREQQLRKYRDALQTYAVNQTLSRIGPCLPTSGRVA